MQLFFEHISIKSKIIIGLIILLTILFFEISKELYISKNIQEIQFKQNQHITKHNKLRETLHALEAEMQSFNTLRIISTNNMFEMYWPEHKRILKNTQKHLEEFLSKSLKDTLQHKQTNFTNIDSVLIQNINDLNQYYTGFYISKAEYLLHNTTDFELLDQDTQMSPFSSNFVDTVFQKPEKESLKIILKEYENAIDESYKKMIYKINKENRSLQKDIFKSREMILSQIKYSNRGIILTFSMGITLTFMIISLLIKSILKPITEIKTQVEKLSEGKLPAPLIIKSKDEFSQIAQKLNLLVVNLRKVSDFSYEIGVGHYTTKYTPLSEHDVLGNSLIDMRKRLKEAEQITTQKNIDEKIRSWIATGHTEISTILQQQKTIDELSYDLIKFIIKYINANVGGLYLIEKTITTKLRLSALHAYNRKRIINKEIEHGDGLLWSSINERETIYTTNLPNDFIEIKSGLGECPPKALLIVPLKTEDEVLGIIEIASICTIENHKIEFIEKVGEHIAVTFSNKQMSIKTADLLKQSQLQTEQLHEQEEIMRQNLKQLQGTKKVWEKKEADLKTRIKQLENKLSINNIDLD